MVRLNDVSHRVIRLTRGSPPATSGDIQISEELTYINDIKVSNLPTESTEILLALHRTILHLHPDRPGGSGRSLHPSLLRMPPGPVGYQRRRRQA